jgi:hypothetical protein
MVRLRLTFDVVWKMLPKNVRRNTVDRDLQRETPRVTCEDCAVLVPSQN